jgi:predicted nucleic acid-binding protein
MTYLLGTNVISELRRLRPDPQVLAWYNSVPSAEIFISVLSIGEIRQGIERLRRKDPGQADALEQWLRGLQRTYRDHIVDVDVGAAQEWGRMNVPDPLPVIDGLLAATARTQGWTLVTRSTADLARTGIALLDPFGPLLFGRPAPEKP